jgi:hypothetical protein
MILSILGQGKFDVTTAVGSVGERSCSFHGRAEQYSICLALKVNVAKAAYLTRLITDVLSLSVK